MTVVQPAKDDGAGIFNAPVKVCDDVARRRGEGPVIRDDCIGGVVGDEGPFESDVISRTWGGVASDIPVHPDVGLISLGKGIGLG